MTKDEFEKERKNLNDDLILMTGLDLRDLIGLAVPIDLYSNQPTPDELIDEYEKKQTRKIFGTFGVPIDL